MYKFSLSNGLENKWVSPIYSDGSKLKYEKPSGEQYLLPTLDMELIFMKSDYQFISNSSFESEFVLSIWNDSVIEISCDFTWMDLDVDEDSEKITVKPSLISDYRDIVAKKDEKHRISELGLASVPITYDKRPLIQIYVPGSSYMTNIIGASVSTEKVNPISDFGTLEDLQFRTNFNHSKAYVTGTQDSLTENVSGVYNRPVTVATGGGNTIYYPQNAENGIYSIGTFDHSVPQFYSSINLIVRTSQNIMDDIKDVGSVWQTATGSQHTFVGVAFVDGLYTLFFAGGTQSNPTSGTITHISGGVNTTSITGDFNNGYSHKIQKGFIYKSNPPSPEVQHFVYVTKTKVIDYSEDDTLDIGDKKYYAIQGDDEVNVVWKLYYTRIWSDKNVLGDMLDRTDGSSDADNFNNADKLSTVPNFKYVRGVTYDGFKYFDEYEDEDQGLGVIRYDAANGSDQFFKEYEIQGEQWLKIEQERWDYVSLWFNWSQWFEDFSNTGSTEIVLNDGYRIHDLIQSLLSKMEAGLLFNNDVTYSEFLYGDVLEGHELFYTPKSNIVRYNYSEPASRVEISLQDVFTFLKSHKVFWHMEGKQLRLENIIFYRNGHSYDSTIDGMDFTKIKEPKTQKPWSIGQNKFKYNKDDIAETIKFKWMDDCSLPFEGFNIKNKSIYVKEGKVDSESMGSVTTDLDVLTSRGSQASLEGGVYLMVKDGRVSYVSMSISPNKTWNLQNGHLSFVYLHDKYWMDDMHTLYGEVNGIDITANTVKRSKIQSIEVIIDNINIIGLLKTGLGKGNIKSLELDIGNNYAKTVIEHDN